MWRVYYLEEENIRMVCVIYIYIYIGCSVLGYVVTTSEGMAQNEQVFIICVIQGHLEQYWGGTSERS